MRHVVEASRHVTMSRAVIVIRPVQLQRIALGHKAEAQPLLRFCLCPDWLPWKCSRKFPHRCDPEVLAYTEIAPTMMNPWNP